MKNLKKILSQGKVTRGSWVVAGNTITTEIIARRDFDWIVVDMEHSGLSMREMLQLVQIIESSDVIPLVRVGHGDFQMAAKAMDAGAHGVIVAQVNSAEDARCAVSAVHYPPKGKRGVGLSRASAYGLEFENYAKWIAKNAVVIVQIENMSAIDNLEDILSVEGVDASIIGPYDLSTSLGIPGKFQAQLYNECVEKYIKTSKKVGKPAGYHIVQPDPRILKQKEKEGYRFLAYGTDTLFLASGLGVSKIKIKQLKGISAFLCFCLLKIFQIIPFFSCETILNVS
jgi:2-keto-3-deoxy-L-rhamnonate aldolase RhmA